VLHRLVARLFSIYELLILARILLSWIRPATYHPVIGFIVRVTDPVLEPARRVVPSVGAIDLSPILVFLVLGWLRQFLVINLMRLGL
jgi:YggT family protein